MNATTSSPPPEVDTVEESGRTLGSVLRELSENSFFWILLVLIALVAVFTAVLPSGTFISTFNAQTLAEDSSTLLILAVGATFVIITGGIDLSIGSVMTFAAALSVVLMKSMGGTEAGADVALVGLLVCLGSGAAWGAINGLLIAFLELPPFVVTLGSLGAALGAARLLTEGTNASGTPKFLQDHIGGATVLEIPVPFLIAIGVVIIFGVTLAACRFGEHNYMIGSNEEAARRGGISVARHLLVIYTLSGMMAGLAGFVEVSRFTIASVSTGHTTELIAVLAAVVIGGASLTGGVGRMSGTVVGVMIPVVLANGLLIGGIERFWQDIVVGVILVAAVAFDQWRRVGDPRRG